MRFLTNRALIIKGDRVEQGTIVELTEHQAAHFDAADLTVADEVAETTPEEEAVDETPLEEMTHEQLKARAKALGLPVLGSKADLMEKIKLQEGAPETPEEETED